MKFLKNFLIFVLIIIIVGGVGFIGYSFFFMNHSSMPEMTASNSDTGKTSKSSDSGKSSMDMPADNQNQQSNNQQSNENPVGLAQSNLILQNKDSLEKSIADLNEALKLMTFDPYAPSSNSSSTGNMLKQGNTPVAQGNAQTNTTTTPAGGGNNTTINIYPRDGTNSTEQASASQQNNMAMQNMGTTYDPNKMEQLHNGLYKISVGMALLDQLDSQLVNQAENANANTQNIVQYYTNRYDLTVQSKMKLNQALEYVNDAVSLININPYVSSNGLVYDKDRMNQIHQSVVKFADGVVSLNQLSDNFTKQTIVLSNTVQNYINNSNSDMNMASMNTSNGLFGGLFNNISLSGVVNVILVLFVIGLILGIFGFIFSLLRPSAQKIERKENEIL